MFAYNGFEVFPVHTGVMVLKKKIKISQFDTPDAPGAQGLRETSSRSVNANDRSWCFSAQFGFGCLDLAFLNNC